jgi:hypothetical protein
VFVVRVFPWHNNNMISGFNVSENKITNICVQYKNIYNIQYNIQYKKWENRYFIFNDNKYVRLTYRASVAFNEKGSCGIRLSGIRLRVSEQFLPVVSIQRNCQKNCLTVHDI